MNYNQNNQDNQNNQPPYNNYYYYSPFQPPYYQQAQEPQQPPVKEGQAIASMVLGILALCGLNILFAIISLCLAGASKRNNNGLVLGMAKAGKICSILAIVFSVLIIALYLFVIMVIIMSGADFSTETFSSFLHF